MAPLVVGNHVLVGTSGDFDNLAGYIRSVDPENGEDAVAVGCHAACGNPGGAQRRQHMDDRHLRS